MLRVLFGPLCLLPAGAGCRIFQPAEPLPILVRDAETKQPVPGAKVLLWSPEDRSTGKDEPTGTTGADGIARVKSKVPKDADVLIAVSAEGFMPDEVDRAIAVKTAGSPTGGGVIEIFRGPRPTVELLIPSEYRGDVKVIMKIQDDVPFQPGQRTFGYEVPASGVVTVIGPPVLAGSLGATFKGRYANGNPMPDNPKDTDVVLRWVRSEGLDQYFVVGTKIDQDAARRMAEKEVRSNGSGGGRGGRRGMSGGGGMGGGMGGQGMGAGGGMSPGGGGRGGF
jgi:hypothetical protein